jgi:phage terminase large subunit-like protein
LQIEEELKKRQTKDLCKTYVPCVKAEKFIAEVGNMNFISIFLAANGVGKSCVGANIIANICFGTQYLDKNKTRWEKKWGPEPDTFFDYPLFKKFSYKNKRIRIVSDPTTIREKIIPELRKWFPTNGKTKYYEMFKEGKAYESKIRTSTGFVIDLLTYEQDPKEFESVDCGFIWFDEPSPKNIFIASIARLREGGQAMMTLTPLSYSAWIKDDLYDKQEEKNVKVVEANVWDNCYEYENTRGILKLKDIENMIQQYPEDEKLARIEGKFGHLLGLVHKAFSRDVHVIKPFTINKEDYVVYMAHDTHPRVPDAINWMAIDRKGTKYIIDELVITGTDAEMAAIIKQKEMFYRVDRRLLDPSGFNNDTRSSEKPFGDRMLSHGLRYYPGSKDLIGGIRALDNAFNYEMKNGVMVKPPEVYIFSSCGHTIKELENYVWDEFVGRGSDMKDPKPKPKDKNDHNVENLHRLIIEDFRWYPRAVQESEPVQDPYSIIQVI